MFLLLGMYAAFRDRHPGTVAAAVASIATLPLVVGTEFILNLVFPYLSPAAIAALRHGPLGVGLTVTSLLFLATAWATAVALGRHGGSPRLALAAYAVGGSLVALRAFVSPSVLALGLAVLTLGIGGMAAWLLRRARTVDAVAPAAG